MQCGSGSDAPALFLLLRRKEKPAEAKNNVAALSDGVAPFYSIRNYFFKFFSGRFSQKRQIRPQSRPFYPFYQSFMTVKHMVIFRFPKIKG